MISSFRVQLLCTGMKDILEETMQKPFKLRYQGRGNNLIEHREELQQKQKIPSLTETFLIPPNRLERLK